MKKTAIHLMAMRSTKYGAIEKFILNLCKLSKERGMRTIVQYEQMPQSSDYIKDLRESGIDLAIISTHRVCLKSMISLIRLIYREKPKLVHIHFLRKHYLFFIPFLVHWLTSGKVYRTVHNPPLDEKESNWRKRIRAMSFNRCDKVFAYSPNVHRALIEVGAKPSKIANHALGLFGKYNKTEELRHDMRNDLCIPLQDIVIACIAFDARFKGVDILLRAFQKIIEKHSRIHLLSIGIDPDISQLPAFAEELKIAHRVHWAGIVNHGWRVLNAADIYVQPSRLESLGLATIEAMAMALPVIVSDGAGISEFLTHGKNCLIAPAENIEGLADKIEEIITHPDWWPVLGKAGQQVYQNYFRGEKAVENLFEQFYR